MVQRSGSIKSNKIPSGRFYRYRYTLLIALGLSLFLVPHLHAQQLPAAEPFKGGDRWVAIGDSITHGGSYHKFVYLYYATRFPERQIDFFNAGISGDTAAGANRRFEWDIMGNKPSVVTIMLGMNDVGSNLYTPIKPSDNAKDSGIEPGKVDTTQTEATRKTEAQRQARIDDYANNLRKLAQRLKDAGIRMTFLTPSIFDQTVLFSPAPTGDQGPNHPGELGTNDGLKRCAERVREIAKEVNAPVIDFNGPMERINQEQQKQNPGYTLVGRDRVHPGDTGHFVMAYLLLKGQNVPSLVSETTIDARKRKAITANNCRIDKIKTKRGEIDFDSTENALPFPTADTLKPALDLVPFTKELNQELLRVSGLAKGNYQLHIDNTTVGTFSAESLAEGINLATLPDTPQMQQAKKVSDLNDKRHNILRDQLRTIAYIEFILRPQKDAQGNPDYLNEARRQSETATGYRKSSLLRHLEVKPKQQEYEQQETELIKQMREAARPIAHHFALMQQGTGGEGVSLR